MDPSIEASVLRVVVCLKFLVAFVEYPTVARRVEVPSRERLHELLEATRFTELIGAAELVPVSVALRELDGQPVVVREVLRQLAHELESLTEDSHRMAEALELRKRRFPAVLEE